MALDDHDPKTDQSITATAVGTDLDGDPVSFTYQWSVDAVVVPGPTSTLDLSLPGNGDKDDSITVVVTPTDGTDDGVGATDSITVGNTAPVLAQPRGPVLGRGRRDQPGHGWVRRGRRHPDLLRRGAAHRAFHRPGHRDRLRDRAVQLGRDLPGHRHRHRRGRFRPGDLLWTVAHTNRAPVVDSVVIDQASPKTDDTLSVTVTAHDPDGSDPTLFYQWFKGTAPSPEPPRPPWTCRWTATGTRVTRSGCASPPLTETCPASR